MNRTKFQKASLALAGGIALGISAFILSAPHGFYAGYNIFPGDNIDLLSELRAPAAGLLLSGMAMLAGILRTDWMPISIICVLVVYVGYPIGRVIGIIVDGMPSTAILAALAIEIVIATLCLLAFRREILPRTRA